MKKLASFKWAVFLLASVLLYASAWAQPTSGQASTREFASAYSGKASVMPDKDMVTIKTRTGAVFQQVLMNTGSLLSGSDEKGRTFSLALKGKEPRVSGVLTVGRLSFTAAGTTSQVITALNKQVGASPNALKLLPQSTAITSLVARVGRDPEVIKGITAQPAATSRRVKNSDNPGGERYCKAVCDACAGGGPFSPWYCLSCASCGLFCPSCSPDIRTVRL